MELEQDGEKEALITAAEVEESTLGRPERLVVLPLFEQAGALSIQVKPPAEVVLEEFAERRLLAPQKEEQIWVVLLVEKRRLCKHVEHGPHALASATVERESTKFRRFGLGMARIVNHDEIPASRA